MRCKVYNSSLILALLPLASCLDVFTPTSVTANALTVISWSSAVGDPSEFNILLTNNVGLLQQNLTLAQNVSTSTGASFITFPNVSAGQGYQIVLVPLTSLHPLTTSGSFDISAAKSADTSTGFIATTQPSSFSLSSPSPTSSVSVPFNTTNFFSSLTTSNGAGATNTPTVIHASNKATVGGAIGGIVGLLLVLIGSYVLYYRRRRTSSIDRIQRSRARGQVDLLMSEAAEGSGTWDVGGVRTNTTRDSFTNHDRRASHLTLPQESGRNTWGESSLGLLSSFNAGLPHDLAPQQQDSLARTQSPGWRLGITERDYSLTNAHADDDFEASTHSFIMTPTQLDNSSPNTTLSSTSPPPLSKPAVHRQELVRQLEEMQHTVNELEEQEHNASPVLQGPTATGDSAGQHANEGWRSEVEVLRRQVATLRAQLDYQQQAEWIDLAEPPPSYVSDLGEHDRNV